MEGMESKVLSDEGVAPHQYADVMRLLVAASAKIQFLDQLVAKAIQDNVKVTPPTSEIKNAQTVGTATC